MQARAELDCARAARSGIRLWRRVMRLAHLRARHAVNRTETLQPLRGIEMRSRRRHEFGLMLALAELLQQHAVAWFKAQRVEQIAQTHEDPGLP